MNSIIESFFNILKPDQILKGSDLQERYHHIWHMDKPLFVRALLLPESTSQVSEIMKICDMANQPVTVFGGLTNLVGSTETNEEEVVISMERMNTIENPDLQSRTITVEAGAILENIQNKVTESGMLFPLNYGAKGSAQIGGSISTNAGGLQVIRYGMTRNLVLGLEVVLANGTILTSLKKIIKDNSGYDLKQLFIGSEGTLGIVTKAVLKLVESPKSQVCAFVGINNYDNVVEFMRFMDKGLAGTMSSFELIWKNSFITLTKDPSIDRTPLPYDYNYYVLVESLGSNQQQDQLRFENLLEDALNSALIEDAALAYVKSELNWFWHIRENVDALVAVCKYDQHFDISVPVNEIGRTITSITEDLEKINGVAHIFPFGHVGDGNIHFIIGKESEDDSLRKKINSVIYKPLKALGGSVSAEHGIGLHKKDYLHLCRTTEEITLMKQLKHLMDPKQILNRGKILDMNGK
ncbi:FAD-binding oxidoreductase [Ichthyenterobacterium sp. W332]|uniref:FAD-binding oxidoreductase n=1 Tax=Microcosmobacter mediterraneus TaxID=3075607 RepID=A0ABU2YNG4_9FLAO|nr:FAD-binding oxidoreductase [Ichthyenterobacterium sp. W332]MDT0558805.1 FAD-binding oxidoreductase [Ichthyenterobacterium sp. W332]